MRGVVLAGGTGSRLHPLTFGMSKQLLPIYDKPMIYYPISVLMLAGIRDILVVSTPQDIPNFQRLLGCGEQFGVRFCYAEQVRPAGIAEVFLIAEKFLTGESVALILGDNLFYGYGFSDILRTVVARENSATIFGYEVATPERFGVLGMSPDGQVTSIEEKPETPKSNCAVTGLYFYDEEVVELARTLIPSARGELEITDLNQIYLDKGKLHAEMLGRGFAWMDAGTPETLLEASQFVHSLESRQGLKVACLEEIGFKNGWLSAGAVLEQARRMTSTCYGQYLVNLVSQ